MRLSQKSYNERCSYNIGVGPLVPVAFRSPHFVLLPPHSFSHRKPPLIPSGSYESLQYWYGLFRAQ